MEPSWIHRENFSKIQSQSYLQNSPFEHYSLEKGFNEEKLTQLVESLKHQEYYIEDHDLYQFKRTVDFKHSKDSTIKNFREFIFSDEFVTEIERITGLSLVRREGDLHSLKLEHTHYLLCHDDQVQDRAVAFILNLSKDWKEEDGGLLELFSCDSKVNPTKVSVSIVPDFNQFNFFTVSSKSFHQISEVLSKTKNRLSISGWFYPEKIKK